MERKSIVDATLIAVLLHSWPQLAIGNKLAATVIETRPVHLAARDLSEAFRGASGSVPAPLLPDADGCTLSSRLDSAPMPSA